MKTKEIMVSGKDAFIGSIITHTVEQSQLGTICAYCSRGPEALRCIEEMRPNLIILDLFLPGMNGLSILKSIQSRDYHPLILAYCRKLNKMIGVKCAKQGATGLIDYSATYEQAYDCLERVSWGQKIYPEEVWELLRDNDYEKYFQKYTDVTVRQAQILELSARSYTNIEISEMLHLNIKTVEKHKHTVRIKYGLSSVDQLIHFAIRNGIIEREESICS
ncbi:response regulator transcription factor [Oceanispirochaeta crateris]|uniref:Response regulator transcription factor n=1 Tax=Oceanispirochaeta crateris TaxID=2518645 RepID=A0A5C1QJX2_9SPIO|nr:response regulator transcription factor [Oceanispirochaeta crateris]QEN06816.1 response regulator transcription factor [Oceanispirochaeta crateris]